MDIHYRDLKEHKIVELKGDIDYFSVSELKNALFKLIHDKAPSIILDLQHVEYMDSSGLGLIVTAHRVMNNYNGKISLVNVCDDIRVILKLATVDTLLTIYKNNKEIE
jgi:anti-anti-sigma factor